MRVDIALGFGLFAILSIIRLRSTSVTQQEVAYYFVALVMGLVNGMDIPDRRLVVMINVPDRADLTNLPGPAGVGVAMRAAASWSGAQPSVAAFGCPNRGAG